MCGGGGSSPPPPPDYTAEKAQFAADTLAGYQAEADAYNTGVDTFNTNLTGYNTTLGEAETALAGANIYDLYDDPDTTDVNEDPLAGYTSQLNNFDYDSITNPDFGDAPIFDPVVQSPWGAVTIADIPDLSSANTTLADDLYGRGQNLSSGIDNLYGQRETALTDYLAEGDALEAETGKFTNLVNRADINSDFGALENQLVDLNLDANNIINSGFYDQTRFGDMDRDAYVSNIESKIASLESAKAAEQTRISNYESGLNTSANSFATEIDGLGITDVARINAIQNEIDTLRREAGQFNSQLGYDFSQELGGFGGSEAELTRILNERKAEEERVEGYQSDTLEGVRSLRDNAFSTGMYDMGSLDALDQSLIDFKSDAGAFSSVLPYEVAGLDDYYKTISDRSTSLRGDRKDALDALSSRIGGITGGLDNIALYNEGAFSGASSDLRDIGFDLGRFSGGRVDEIAGSIASGQREVDTKMKELQAYRAKLEEDMIAYLEDIRTRDYYNFEDVASAREDVYGKESDVRLYRAQQAMDEIDDMISSLDGQDKRLKADARALEERQAAAQQGVGFGRASLGSGSFSPMTANQYSAFVNSGGEEDPSYASSPSAFSNALGVIRI